MLRFTRTDWRILAFVAILASLLVIVCTLALGAQLAHASTPASTPSVPAQARTCPAPTEDSPGWDWTRCGNHRRGVVTVNGTPLVVGPCRFRRLMQDLQLDYRPTDVLKGDRWAYLHGCER